MKKIILILALVVLLIFPIYSQDKDEEWYRTQVGTGSDGNCGPASVAMTILWSTEYNISVEQVRNYIGYTRPDGATDFMELAEAMRNWDVPYDIEIIQSLVGLKSLVDRKDLMAIVLIDTKGITYDPDGKFNRNYSLEVGHYIVLNEVYSSYFVVQDPMPGGHDRRYHVDEVWNSLKDHRVILVRNYDER